MEEQKEIDKVDMCAKFLVKTMLDTNATQMKITQEGFSFQGKFLGDFEVIVRKIKK